MPIKKGQLFVLQKGTSVYPSKGDKGTKSYDHGIFSVQSLKCFININHIHNNVLSQFAITCMEMIIVGKEYDPLQLADQHNIFKKILVMSPNLYIY